MGMEPGSVLPPRGPAGGSGKGAALRSSGLYSAGPGEPVAPAPRSMPEPAAPGARTQRRSRIPLFACSLYEYCPALRAPAPPIIDIAAHYPSSYPCKTPPSSGIAPPIRVPLAPAARSLKPPARGVSLYLRQPQPLTLYPFYGRATAASPRAVLPRDLPPGPSTRTHHCPSRRPEPHGAGSRQ